MRRLLVVLVLALIPTAAFAIDIDKKWGLSAGIADSEGQLSLIRGRANGAFILDFALALTSQEISEDEPTVNDDITLKQEFSAFTVGPRWRRFGRPDAKLSPYLDIFGHFVQTKQRVTQDNATSGSAITQTISGTGAEFGLGLGVEFETAWSINIAAHTDFLQATWSNLATKINTSGNDNTLSGTGWELEAAFNPALFARVYF